MRVCACDCAFARAACRGALWKPFFSRHLDNDDDSAILDGGRIGVSQRACASVCAHAYVRSFERRGGGRLVCARGRECAHAGGQTVNVRRSGCMRARVRF